MRVTMIGNLNDDDDGLVGARLADLGATFSRYRREDPYSLQGCEKGSDLLVLLGSDWSVYGASNNDAVRAEEALVRRAQLRGLPILGICFGGQLVSAALGLEVEPSNMLEIGWHMVETDDEAACPSGPWFEYHFDRWNDAGEIHSIARTPGGPQAYWYGRTLALQFHPEVTTEIIERWLNARYTELVAIGVDVDQIMVDSGKNAGAAKERCYQLVDLFLGQVDGKSYPTRMG